LLKNFNVKIKKIIPCKAFMTGAVLVALILKTKEDESLLEDLEWSNTTTKSLLIANSTTGYDFKSNCGAKNCPQTIMPPTLSKPILQSTYNLCYSMIASIVVAILVTVLFLDNIADDEMSDQDKEIAISISNN
jgi:hypothetical protein